jgi:chorismate mutase
VAYNFKGTFNRSQFIRLATYLRSQIPLIDARLTHLAAERVRVGSLVMRFTPGSGNPTGSAAPDSDTSYLGQLFAAYKVLGGDPIHDLQIRSITDPVYLLRGDESAAANRMSNGEPLGQKGLGDAVTANLVSQMRYFADDAIMRRREILERKIRRVVDYGDQLAEEMAVLEKIRSSAERKGSLEKLISEVEALFTDKGYRAIYDDGGKDIYGKLTYAPFAIYEPGSDRPPSKGPERGANGVVLPGEKSSA